MLLGRRDSCKTKSPALTGCLDSFPAGIHYEDLPKDGKGKKRLDPRARLLRHQARDNITVDARQNGLSKGCTDVSHEDRMSGIKLGRWNCLERSHHQLQDLFWTEDYRKLSVSSFSWGINVLAWAVSSTRPRYSKRWFSCSTIFWRCRIYSNLYKVWTLKAMLSARTNCSLI